MLKKYAKVLICTAIATFIAGSTLAARENPRERTREMRTRVSKPHAQRVALNSAYSKIFSKNAAQAECTADCGDGTGWRCTGDSVYCEDGEGCIAEGDGGGTAIGLCDAT